MSTSELQTGDTSTDATMSQIADARRENIRSSFGLKHKLKRFVWQFVWSIAFRPSLRSMHGWRLMLLRLFGAKIGRGSHVYSRVRVWAPWNLTMGELSCLADDVDCYCVAPITIGSRVTISQYTYLCAATHDHTDAYLPLVPMPINIEDHGWICADVFVGPGVTIGQGAVVGARSTVVHDLPAWKVCVGNPAKPIKERIVKQREALEDTH